MCIKDPVLPGELEEPGGRVAQREVRHNGGTMDSSRVRQGRRKSQEGISVQIKELEIFVVFGKWSTWWIGLCVILVGSLYLT